MDSMQILSLVTTLFTIGMFLAGIPDCLNIVRTGNTENVPFLPFLATDMNNILWLAYGYLKQDTTLLIVNGVGITLQTTYMVVFLLFTQARRKPFQQILLACAAMVMLYVYMTGYIVSHDVVINQLGLVCCTVTVLMYISPLAEIASVIRSRSTAGISLPLTVSTLFASSLWVLYGVVVNDLYIQVPNIPGVLSSLVRIILVWKYKDTPTTKPAA